MPILMTTVTAFTYIAGLLVRGAEGGACPGPRREAGFSLLPGCCTQWLGSSKAGGHPAFAHAGVAPTWGAHPLRGAAADCLAQERLLRVLLPYCPSDRRSLCWTGGSLGQGSHVPQPRGARSSCSMTRAVPVQRGLSTP